MASRGKQGKRRDVKVYAHIGEERSNNPPIGLVTAGTDPDGTAKTYAHDPHIDPQLTWAGKAEHTSFDVPTVSLHVHERIDPRTIIAATRKRNGAQAQQSLFAGSEENPPLRQAIEFYQHRRNWTNRLIAGDSLLVMNSLLEKEGLGGQVQTVFIDPPYGISYGSNFQPFVNQREVTDGASADLTREPEMIRAFRDTWKLGIHSYLSYLRDRLLLARELLHARGSVFVQIGDENVHRVGVVADEVFGAENRMATITFASTGSSSSSTLPQVEQYLLWYAKDRQCVKCQKLYESLRTPAEIIAFFNWHAMLELPDGRCRPPTPAERLEPPKDARIYCRQPLLSSGASTTGRSKLYKWNGREFPCGAGKQWSISKDGMDRLAALGRLDALESETSLRWKIYADEILGRRIHNIWARPMRPKDKGYAVETATQVVQRCILMSTDPGDLVFDPTCGGGTTAFVAEQWGRRWISCDTSRVAVAVTKQRLMTAYFDYYQLACPQEGVGAGFRCERKTAVSPSILGYDQPPTEVVLWDRPEIDRGKARVTGPFTFEAVPAPTVRPLDAIDAVAGRDADASVSRMGETARQADWRDELFKTGIRGKTGQRISFTRLEPAAGMRWLHAQGETRPDDDSGLGAVAVVVSFGPEHAPLERRQVERALEEARHLVPMPQIVVFSAFQFDAEAAKDIAETHWPGVALLQAQMDPDLLVDDLLKQRASNESFWLIGQPDVDLERITEGEDAGKFRVVVRGFDYYNIKTGKLESGDADRIAMWMLDPDYDGRSLFARQVFFPMTGAKAGWARLARSLKAEIDADLIEAYRGTVSLPFAPGEHARVAVKIVDDRGIESLKVMEVK